MVLVARLVALAVSVSTFVFLFLHDSWRADNIFLVPDLVLCVALAVTAALPLRSARPALVAALCFAAGVFTTSVASYAVRGGVGVASLVGVVACVGTAVALVGTARTSRVAQPG
ncbi:MAG: hypothetical protein GEV07_00375 [Streptosporangiales bacterium]|nr:hypothetical protein [Streptosporangiales bacterium]